MYAAEQPSHLRLPTHPSSHSCPSPFPCHLPLPSPPRFLPPLLTLASVLKGVAGIGIVNAVEVVHAFGGRPDGNGLLKFKQWLDSPDEQLVATAARLGIATSGAGDNAEEDDGGLGGWREGMKESARPWRERRAERSRRGGGG